MIRETKERDASRNAASSAACSCSAAWHGRLGTDSFLQRVVDIGGGQIGVEHADVRAVERRSVYARESVGYVS